MSNLILLPVATLLLAYANGANDNFKGVATLYGSGVVGYRTALVWASLTTAAGSLLSVGLAETLVGAFSGRGLVPEEVAARPEFLTAVALGAAATVLLAARFGFPISTTHALTGGLLGAGLLAAGHSLSIARLGASFFLPLAASPLLAVVLGAVATKLFGPRYGDITETGARELCLCVIPGPAFVPIEIHGSPSASVAGGSLLPIVRVASGACGSHPGPTMVVSRRCLWTACHFLSSGAVSFARGLNDAPKILGMLAVLGAFRLQGCLVAVASAMIVGGVVHARPVAETMSRRITTMSDAEGLLANLVTSSLVLTASWTGLPVSTTHVSCGAIFGMGLRSGKANPGVVGQIALSWILTLPLAAALAAAALWLLG